MARYFLNKFERKKLESYPEFLLKDDMSKFFTLTSRDIDFLKNCRGDSNKIGNAIQICTIKFIGFIPINFFDLSKIFIKYISKQLNLDWNSFYNYAEREQTRTEHLNKILIHLNFKYYDAEYEKKLQIWLNERALEHDSSSVLLNDSFKKLHEEKYLRLSITTLEKCISIARQNALKVTYDAIKHIITDNNKHFFNKILSPHDEIENITYLRWLALRETSNSVNSILSALNKIEFLKKFAVHKWFSEGINANRKKFLARIARSSTPAALDKSEEKRKYQILVFFLIESYDDLIDEIVDIFIRLMYDKFRKCKRQIRDLRDKNAKNVNEKIIAFLIMGKIHLNPGIHDSKVRKKTFEKIPREKIQKMLVECKKLVRPVDSSIWDFYVKNYSQIKIFYPNFIKMIGFYSKFVFEKNGNINKKYYELCVLWMLRLGLKSGEIWTERGRKYTNPDDWLIPIAKWPEIKPEYLKITSVESIASNKLKELRDQTISSKIELDKNIKLEKNIRIENKKVIISPVKAEDIPQIIKDLDELVSYHIPKIELTDLIIEVANWLNLSECFIHAGGDESRLEPGNFKKRLYACLFAQGCNVELSKMAEHSGCTESELAWFNNWYIREDTVMHGSNRAVDYQFNNKFSHNYGGGELSSSDGKRARTPVKSKKSANIVKYFAFGKGVTLYSWTSNQFSQFGSKVNVPIEKDSPYVLDAIFDNETLLPLKEHTTDTSGFTDLVFAMFDLGGLRFSPRIKDLTKYKLYGFRGMEINELDPSKVLFAKDPLREKLIVNNWDEMQRFAASIKFGYIPASFLMTKILAYPEKSSVTRALVEYGKCIRTLHSMRCMNDINHRRDMLKQLNKGENINNLRGFLYFGNNGEMRKSQEENQSCQAACITLLTNFIICWNTKYIEQVIKMLKKSGKVIHNKDIQFITPCRFSHINKYGKYNFELENGLRDGELRKISIE